MKPAHKILVGGALVASTIVGGAIGSSFVGTASAQTSDTTATTTAPAASDAAKPTGPHTANGKTETSLTGSDADKATAAALAKVPGATVDRVETDADGDTYEAHITTADGTKQTVKMDENFNVTSVEDGPSGGGRGHGGGHGGPHSADGKTEAVLTGDDAAKATAAALEASPGATVDRVESDADGDAYEAHITKADGTKATVKMDSNFKVTSVEDGMK